MTRVSSSYLVVLLFVMIVAANQTSVRSEELRPAKCDTCGTAQKGKLVECVVMVPTTVVEQRMKTCCVEGKGTVTETYTVFKKVPVTKKIYREECYLVDEVKTKTITNKQCHLVEVPEEITYPAQELRYKGCKKGDAHTEITEPVTAHCTKTVVGMSTITKDITYCVKVPKYKKILCAEITTYKLEPVEMTREIHVCEPRIQEYPVDVTVCKMVPRKIQCCSTCAQQHK